MKTIKFIDLFAGLGGLRIGFENALKNNGIVPECVMTSEIKWQKILGLRTQGAHYFLKSKG